MEGEREEEEEDDPHTKKHFLLSLGITPGKGLIRNGVSPHQVHSSIPNFFILPMILFTFHPRLIPTSFRPSLIRLPKMDGTLHMAEGRLHSVDD